MFWHEGLRSRKVGTERRADCAVPAIYFWLGWP